MTTNSGDATTGSDSGATDRSGSAPVDTPSSSGPYDVGLVTDADETAPKPLDADLEDEQVRGDA